MIRKICIRMLLVGIFSVTFGLLVIGQNLEKGKFFSVKERKTIPAWYRKALEFPTNRQIVEFDKTIMAKDEVEKIGWWYKGIIQKDILSSQIQNDIAVSWTDEEGFWEICRFQRFNTGRFLVQVKERNSYLLIGVRDTKVVEASEAPEALKESAFEIAKTLFNPGFVPSVPTKISIRQLSKSDKEKGLKGDYGLIQLKETERKPPIIGGIRFWSNRKVVVFKILKAVHVHSSTRPPRSDDPFE